MLWTRRLFMISGSLLPAVHGADWPSYRGPGAKGVGEGSAPATWNGDAAKGPLRNIRWKTPIPGLGHSSPAISGDRIFVITAVSSAGKAPLKTGLYGSGASAEDEAEQAWEVFCLHKHSGKILWQQTAYRGKPKSPRHTKATHANTTVATDGKRAIAMLGSEGLYSYTVDGRLEWKKEFGILEMAPSDDRRLSWGFASSPVLFENTVVVQSDSKNDGFLAACDATDGRERWRIPRGEVSLCSWATPGVFKAGGRTQIVANGYPYIAGYDFHSGKELWRLKSGGDIPVPVPFMAHGLIYVANAHGSKAPLYAIRPDASGDITPAPGASTSSGVVWMEERNGSYLQTPLVYGDLIYASTSQGILKAYDARSGRKHYEQRLGTGGAFTSSPVAAGGRIYVSNEDGQTFVVKAGPKFEVTAVNEMGELMLSTPAISDEVLYFRTPWNVVAIAE